jgi:uncharacterized surface protein with fasciclin (FAS1) repeats
MKKLNAALFAAGLCAWTAAASEEIRFHGKSVMFSSSSITGNLMQSREHTKLVKALKSVGLDQPLLHSGLFTLFAPGDDAFDKLPADYAESIFRRVNRVELAKLLACHIVSEGKYAGKKLRDRLGPDGKATLKTLGGCLLTLESKDGSLFVTDESGNRGEILEADILQTNGMIDLTDKVMVPRP